MLNSFGMAGRDVFDWDGSDEYHDAVIREYGKKMLKNPESYAFVSMANSCLKAGKARMALDVLEKGMKHHPNLLSAHLCKARIFIETDNLDEAGTILQRIIDQKPENLLARKLMAFVHLKRDEPEEGLEQLDRIMAIEPDHKVPQALHSKLLAARESLGGISEAQQLILNTLEGWLKNAEKMQSKVSA